MRSPSSAVCPAVAVYVRRAAAAARGIGGARRALSGGLALAAVIAGGACVRATDEAAATRTLGDAVSALPCVRGHDITYNDLPTASGAISGKVRVDDAACFERVLRTVATLPDFNRGRSSTVYLTGTLADGTAVVPQAFGLPQPPSLRDLRRRYAGGD